jgi:hypothetical protein
VRTSFRQGQRGLTIDLRDVPAELRRRYEAIRAKRRDDKVQQQLKTLTDEIFIEEILRRAFTGLPRASGARGFFEAINKRALS